MRTLIDGWFLLRSDHGKELSGAAVGAGARLAQPLGLVLLEGVREWAERIGRKHER